MSEFLDVQDEVVEKLEDLGRTNRFSVYDGAIPSGSSLVSTNGRYWPYVVYSFGGKNEAANRLRGITSSRDDLKWTAFVTYCVGDTPTTVRRLKDVVREAFEGYEPRPGWGEFTEVLTGDFAIRKPDPDLIPLRFGEVLSFKSLTDF